MKYACCSEGYRFINTKHEKQNTNILNYCDNRIQTFLMTVKSLHFMVWKGSYFGQLELDSASKSSGTIV